MCWAYGLYNHHVAVATTPEPAQGLFLLQSLNTCGLWDGRRRPYPLRQCEVGCKTVLQKKKGDAVWQNPKRKVDRDELTDIPVPNVQCWNCVAAGNGMPSLCGATALP